MLDTRRIEAFLDTLRAERGAADNTIEAYRRDLEDASEFLTANRSSLIDAGERDLSCTCGVSPSPGRRPSKRMTASARDNSKVFVVKSPLR